MRKLSILFVLVCTVAFVYAAARIYPSEMKPEKFACEEGCYISDVDKVLPYNEPYYPPGKCEVYTCQTDNRTVWYSCGLVAVQPGCHVTEDLSQNYPDCCAKTVCDATTEAPSTTDASTQDDSTTTKEPATSEAPICNH